MAEKLNFNFPISKAEFPGKTIITFSIERRHKGFLLVEYGNSVEVLYVYSFTVGLIRFLLYSWSNTVPTLQFW